MGCAATRLQSCVCLPRRARHIATAASASALPANAPRRPEYGDHGLVAAARICTEARRDAAGRVSSRRRAACVAALSPRPEPVRACVAAGPEGVPGSRRAGTDLLDDPGRQRGRQRRRLSAARSSPCRYQEWRCRIPSAWSPDRPAPGRHWSWESTRNTGLSRCWQDCYHRCSRLPLPRPARSTTPRQAVELREWRLEFFSTCFP